MPRPLCPPTRPLRGRRGLRSVAGKLRTALGRPPPSSKQPQRFCATLPLSRHHGGVLAAGRTQLHPVLPDLCKSSAGRPEDRVQGERRENFRQQREDREGEEGVVDPD